MLKPLSKKSLEKKYAELGLSEEKIAVLHRYYKAFANLYGVIPVKFAWDIFKKYEGVSYIHKKDFIAFSGVVQREGELPYYIIEENEIYDEEKATPEWRMIVNKSLVMRGYYRFVRIYELEQMRQNHSVFIPEKEQLLSFEEDRFYKTDAGRKFAEFICSLKTSGKGMNLGGKEYEIADINGQSVKGKRLDSFTMLTDFEQFDIDCTKSETVKNTLRRENAELASVKVLKRVKAVILEGEDLSVDGILEMLGADIGVRMTDKMLNKFGALYMELNNTSNMWCMFGWSPNELSKKYGNRGPAALSIGANMKQMMENGELDPGELEKELAKLGIKMLM